MKSLFLILSLVLGASILSACDGKDPFKRESNPFKEYSELDEAVPPHNEKARDQYYVSDVLDIRFEEQQESQKLINFVEGETSSHKIRARLFIPGVDFTLKAHDLPDGANLEKDPTDNKLWILTWRPKKGFIPSFQLERSWEMALEIVPSPQKDSRAISKLPSKVERTLSFQLVVRHKSEQPTVLDIQGLKKEIPATGVIPFDVEVSDPASYSAQPPQLVWGYDINQFSEETKIYSGNSAIDWNMSKREPELLENGNWLFHLTYNPAVLAQLHKDKVKNGKIKVQFYLQVLSSASQMISPTYSQSLSIAVETAAPAGGSQ